MKVMLLLDLFFLYKMSNVGLIRKDNHKITRLNIKVYFIQKNTIIIGIRGIFIALA